MASAPLPLPSLRTADKDATPEEFFEFLQNLIKQHLSGSVRIPASERQPWVSVILSLSDHFLTPLPSRHDAAWSATGEKIRLVQITLEVLDRALERVQSLGGCDDFANRMFACLLGFAFSLDAWIDAPDCSEPDLPTPSQLQGDVSRAIINLLHSLGNNTFATGLEGQTWKTMRCILDDGIQVIHDLITSRPTMTFPVYVALFNKPRIQVQPSETASGIHWTVPLEDVSQLSALLVLVLNILVSSVCSSERFVLDLARRATEVTASVFDFLMSEAIPIAGSAKRARSWSHVVTAIFTILTSENPFKDALRHLPVRLLRYRIKQGPRGGWEGLDHNLAQLFDSTQAATPLSTDIFIVSQVLQSENGGEDRKEFQALISAYSRHISAVSIGQGTSPIVVEQRKSTPSVTRMRSGQSESGNTWDRLSWRSEVRQAVQEILAPQEVTWMEDGETCTDEHYASRAFADVRNHFGSNASLATPETRHTAAENLSKLTCLLAHPGQSACSRMTIRVSSFSVPVFLPLLYKVLDGNEEVVAATTRRHVYDALLRCSRHCELCQGSSEIEHVVRFAMRGTEDKYRDVRLKAGRILAEAVGVAGYLEEHMFDQLLRLLETARSQIQETIILTLGLIGRLTIGTNLGRVIRALTTQLGGSNLVLRGTAYMQLLALTKHYQTSPYGLMSPHMFEIAPFLVSHINAKPDLLVETCRFLSQTVMDFLSTTLPITLPPLFAARDTRTLDRIANEVSRKASHLFLDHSHLILAHIFLLLDPTETDRALGFIVQILVEAADGEHIDIQSVVKSCVIQLLTELIVVMGDEAPARAETGIQALKRVERLLSPLSRGRPAPVQDLSVFLKGYMLGLISHINNMLQDAQGKKSASAKRQILRSLGALVTQVGPTICNVAPQIMATLQTMIGSAELADLTLDTWYKFLSTMSPNDVGAHVSATTASIVSSWTSLSPAARLKATTCLDFLVSDPQLGRQLDEVAGFSDIPELRHIQEKLVATRLDWTPKDRLQRILDGSCSDNLTVALQSLTELKRFMLVEGAYVRSLASGDMFDPLVGQTIVTLFTAVCRDGDEMESLRLLAFECIGILGAVDPDRCEFIYKHSDFIVLSNFTDEGESVQFALHLIRDVLVGAFRSTSDIKYQSHLAYAIQELLKFCKFSPALVTPGPTTSIPMKVRNRWNSLPKHIIETIAPLLEGRYTWSLRPLPPLRHPIYAQQPTYREWMQLWTAHLIMHASGETAQSIFRACCSAARNKDVGVARHLLPHLVLNILISGSDEDVRNIHSEVVAVLEDQINPQSESTDDKKLLSAQAVFNLLDHLNKWIRIVRQEIQSKKAESRRARTSHLAYDAEGQLSRVDSILTSINQDLMAKAALKCKAHARALMNFEQLILSLRDLSQLSEELSIYYERLHEIYANLDEADGMEGVSTLIVSPSLSHQIRQHESTGRWTAAQSCWEVRLQQSPDNLDFHLGLLRCLRNLGHYDTLRTHVRGVLTRNPGWASALAGFETESAWMVGAWHDVRRLAENTSAQSPPLVMARLLLAMRSGDSSSISAALSTTRTFLGTAITASGAKGYRRCYDAVLDLHLTQELELIHAAISRLPDHSQVRVQNERLQELSRTLSARLDATLPTFRIREPVLSMRRTAFTLLSDPRPEHVSEIGKAWLASAKIARKASQWQTAYSATLQAQQCVSKFSFIESAKLVKATGEPLRALQELENSMRLFGLIEDNPNVIDLTDDEEGKKMQAKAQVLRARWMNESERFEMTHILRVFQNATDTWPRWESGHYHLGQFHDECFKTLPEPDRVNRGTKMNLYTVKFFSRAIKYGSKYVYQTIPRLLTIWLDMGESPVLMGSDIFRKLNAIVAKAIRETPAYKWYTAFPQIVSRVGHGNPEVYSHLSKLIAIVLQEYPAQALWFFTSVVKSTKTNRERRGKQILDQLKSIPQNRHTQVPALIDQCLAMTNELLALCDYAIKDDSKRTLSMSKDFPRLAALGRSQLIIPLQESLTANLPPTSAMSSTYQPFPQNAPRFDAFADEIEVMKSLARPRKITIRGDNDQIYVFLGKPKDDLRKDARLMDFNSIINKLLKANSESRRRQLHIRTYGVVTLNEECGFIQWVPNTIPVRPVLVKRYEARGIKAWTTDLSELYAKTKDGPDKDVAHAFVTNVLPMYPPVFHDWFIETFPEPSAWLASRLAYGRTAAVMSMVGFILGLGDRHCENILLDVNSGDLIHVDFNCLFEKGKTFETPERVPFRLTQNLVDGLGVTGIEGVFRIACEVTMQLLRDNKDPLMSVLDAFIHDPLVEWEDEKRKLERDRRNVVKASVNLRVLATHALSPIEKKLKGIYSTSKEKHEKEISTSNLVQMLIQEATSPANLWRMYPGWAPWH